jgi:hypothetical protein
LNLRDDLHRDGAKARLGARLALACAPLALLLHAACGGDDRPPVSAANDPANPEAPEAPPRPAPTTLLRDIPSPATAAPAGAPDPHHHHHEKKPNGAKEDR